MIFHLFFFLALTKCFEIFTVRKKFNCVLPKIILVFTAAGKLVDSCDAWIFATTRITYKYLL